MRPQSSPAVKTSVTYRLSLAAPTENGQREVHRPPVGPVKNEGGRNWDLIFLDAPVVLHPWKLRSIFILEPSGSSFILVFDVSLSRYARQALSLALQLWGQRWHRSYPEGAQNLAAGQEADDVVQCDLSFISFNHPTNNYLEPTIF